MQPLPGGILPPDAHGPGIAPVTPDAPLDRVDLFVMGDTYIGHLEYADNTWLAFFYNGAIEIEVGEFGTQEEAQSAVFQAQET